MPPKTRRAKTRSTSPPKPLHSYGNGDKSDNGNNDNKMTVEQLKLKLHPFEVNGSISSDDISLEQRLVIAAMLKKDDAMSDQEILEFIDANYDLINSQNEKLDKRQLRFILNSRAKGKHLFVKDHVDRAKWRLNETQSQPSTTDHTSSSDKEEKSETDNTTTSSQTDHSFQNAIVDLVKKSEYGLPLNEIIEQARSFSDLPGTWQNLPLERRVKASLRSKKELTYDAKTMLWTCDETKQRFDELRRKSIENSVPNYLRELEIPKLTINELYNVLKKEGALY